MTTIVADNGAYSLRLGFATDEEPKLIVPNQIAIVRNDGRELVADETEADQLKHHEMLEYRRPHQRGCLLDPFVEEKIWTRALSQLGGFTISDSKTLITTEPPLLPSASKKASDELFFEKLKFDKVSRISAQACIAADVDKRSNRAKPLMRIIIDCGYSATWIVPVIDQNVPFTSAIKRIDVGGKLLTNLLKEELSWRHVNLMDDTFVVDRCKRAICYVAPDWRIEKPSFAEYLLPDHAEDFEGRLLTPGEQIDRTARQVMRTAQERINVPEVLFNPSRIGLNEAGIAEATFQCVSELPWELREIASRNVVVSGGSSTIPGFMPRLSRELEEYGCVALDWSSRYKDAAWRGAALISSSPNFSKLCVSKQQYEEEGSIRVHKKSRTTGASNDTWIRVVE